MKPLSPWINDLLERIKFMQNWLANGNPDVFWMPAFFFPQGNLNIS